MLTTFLIVFLILIASLMGYQSRLLTLSGAIAATIVGTLVVLGLGFKGLFLLGLFFVSSSFWSKVKSKNKKKAEELLVKGSQRDWLQVMANGALAAISSAVYYITSDTLWLLCFCIALAAANSDTWASEIGSMSRERPVSIKTFKRMDRGTSGAISLLGTFSSLVGSLFIALPSYYLFQLHINEFYLIVLLGFLGSIVDTVLGAFVQASYKCEYCGLHTEKLNHCSTKTTLHKGISFFNNDVVNFLSGFFVVVLGIILNG